MFIYLNASLADRGYTQEVDQRLRCATSLCIRKLRLALIVATTAAYNVFKKNPIPTCAAPRQSKAKRQSTVDTPSQDFGR
jgi:hypothetical protein